MNTIVGKGRFGCEDDIDKIVWSVQIQEKVGSYWYHRGSDSGTIWGGDTYGQSTRQAIAVCDEGRFRTVASSTVYWGSQQVPRTDVSQEVVDPC